MILVAPMALLQFIVGCKPTTTPAPTTQKTPDAVNKEHDHEHGAGPHGGTLADWGGGAYHIEFTVDHDKQEATVYILGSDEKSPMPIKAESIELVIDDPAIELELAAKPLEGEVEGTSSRFVGTHESLGIVKEYAGTITGVIEGIPYTSDFKEE